MSQGRSSRRSSRIKANQNAGATIVTQEASVTLPSMTENLEIQGNETAAKQTATSETKISRPKKKLGMAAEVICALLNPRKKKSQTPKCIPTVSNCLPSISSPFDNRRSVTEVKLPSEIEMVSNSAFSDAESVLKMFSNNIKSFPENEDCCICCEKFEDSSEENMNPVIRLCECQHLFHKFCLMAMYNSGSQTGSIQCPICKSIYGIKTGNQPPGTMDYYVVPLSLPGYSECDTICINYYISSGTQTPDHPHPGRPYSCRGFPRRCYLPDTQEGRKILKLLVTAWERRLIFTVGASVTTGEEDTVTWNEIHHKTEFGSNYSGHGFPDPLYFNNVLQELALQGVTELNSEESNLDPVPKGVIYDDDE